MIEFFKNIHTVVEVLSDGGKLARYILSNKNLHSKKGKAFISMNRISRMDKVVRAMTLRKVDNKFLKSKWRQLMLDVRAKSALVTFEFALSEQILKTIPFFWYYIL